MEKWPKNYRVTINNYCNAIMLQRIFSKNRFFSSFLVFIYRIFARFAAIITDVLHEFLQQLSLKHCSSYH